MLKGGVRFNKSKSVERAQKDAAKGKLGPALEEYRRIAKQDPTDAHIWLKIAELCKRTNDVKGAADAYRQAGTQFRKRGFSARALASFEQAARIEPLDGELQCQLGQLCLEMRRDGDARRYFAAAVEAFVEVSKPRRAIDALCNVVELAPDDMHQRYRLAQMYQAERMHDEASLQYIELSAALLTRGDGRRALQVLKPAYESQPDNTDLLEAMARAFAAVGMRDREAAVLRERERILTGGEPSVDEVPPRMARGTTRRPPSDPIDAQLRKLFNEACVYISYGMTEQAIPLLRTILDEQPDFAEARRALDELLGS